MGGHDFRWRRGGHIMSDQTCSRYHEQVVRGRVGDRGHDRTYQEQCSKKRDDTLHTPTLFHSRA